MKLGDRNIIEHWVVNAAIGFVVRQVAKFGAETKWDLVKKDFAIRAADLMPGKWFDDEVVGLSNELVDACARAFANPKTLGIVLELLAEEKYSEAGRKLADYLLKAWRPETAIAAKAMSLIEGAA